MATRAEIIDGYFRSRNAYPHVPYRPIGQIVVDEVKRQGPDGLYLSAACALVEKESGGKAVMGCDFGPKYTDVPPYCNVEATAARVKALIKNYYTPPVGGANGVAFTQLTSIGYVEEAERLGGAHLAGPNMRVGFRVLLDHINNLGWPSGAAAYNAGAGNWRAVINTYGADMARLEREWAARLAKASGGPTPGDALARDVEEAIAFGMGMIGAPYGTGWRAGTWPALSPLYAGITAHDPPSYYRDRECICSGEINVLRYEVAELPAVGKAQGDGWPGGTAAIGRHLAFGPGSKPYPSVENTPRGWLVWSPYLGEALPLQGHVGVALGDGRVLEARVPTLSANRTEDQGCKALVAGGGKPYTRIIPPSLWLRV